MKNVLGKTIALIGVLAIMASYAAPAVADDGTTDDSATDSVVYTDSEGYMHLVCENDGEPISGLTWQVYYVGYRNGDTIVFNEGFGTAGLDLSSATDDDMAAIAKELENYISEQGIDSDYTFITDSEGAINEKLPDGIYFLQMDEITKDGLTWTASPSVIEINGEWDDVTEVIPKISAESESVPDSSTPDSSKPDSSSPDSKPSSPPNSPPDTPPNTGSAAAIAGAGILLLAAGIGSQIGKHKDKEDK